MAIRILSTGIGIEHTCESKREGDWVVHKCSECAYEFWDNMKTGDTKIFNASVHIRHSGSYVSPNYLFAIENQN